jgi:glycosyltransferase involved in cell wall biosynthesis
MSLDLGGAETHVITLARELARWGHPVAVVSRGGRLTADLEKSGIDHFPAPLDSRSPLSLCAAILRLSRLLREERPEILHAHARIPAWVCNVAAKGRVPLVTTYHGVYASGFPWNLVTVPGDLTIAVSDDIAAHFTRHFRFDPDRIRVILNGIDTSSFRPDLDPRPALAQFNLGGGPRLVHVSRLSGEFAGTAIHLVSAAASLARHYPGFQAVIVGDGDRFDEVRNAATAVNRAAGRDVVVVTGGCEDMPPLYAVADLVVGVARVALEAMACAKPVVLAGEGGFRGTLDENVMDEAVRHNFTARGSGRSVTPGLLERDIRGLLDDPGLRARLGALGRKVVLDGYSVEKMVDMVESVYDEAGSTPGPRRGRTAE